MQVKILSPISSYFQEEIEGVHLRTQEGDITVYPGHVLLLSPLETSKLVVYKKGASSEIIITLAGILKVTNSEVEILSPRFVLASVLNQELLSQLKKEAAVDLDTDQTAALTAFVALCETETKHQEELLA